jgi:hypothetical protein
MTGKQAAVAERRALLMEIRAIEDMDMAQVEPNMKRLLEQVRRARYQRVRLIEREHGLRRAESRKQG